MKKASSSYISSSGITPFSFPTATQTAMFSTMLLPASFVLSLSWKFVPIITILPLPSTLSTVCATMSEPSEMRLVPLFTET